MTYPGVFRGSSLRKRSVVIPPGGSADHPVVSPYAADEGLNPVSWVTLS